MSKYLYNDFELPAIPDSLDRNEYPHATITGSVDSSDNITFLLVVWGLPISLYTNSEGRLVLGPEEGSSYNMGYYTLSSDESSWVNFVQNSTPSVEQSMVWTDTDILNLDEGTIHLEATTPVNLDENTFLYNDVRFPILPNWDRSKFPYTLITSSGTAYFFNKKVKNVAGDLAVDSENSAFTCMTSRLIKSNGLFQMNPTIDEDISTTWLLWIDATAGEVIWSNFDIETESGSVTLAGSRPIDPVTENSVTLYDPPSKETTPKNKFHIPSYLGGLKVGQQECTKRNPTPFAAKYEGISLSGVIPEGGTYYIGVTSTKVADYTGASTTLVAGESFPETLSAGDVFVYDGYEYRYQRKPKYNSGFLGIGASLGWGTVSTETWGVLVADKTKEELGEALSSLCGKIILDTGYMYYECTALKKGPPRLPKYANSMEKMFYKCSVLEDLSDMEVPYNITSINYAFQECSALTKAPDLSRLLNVEEMKYTFQKCSSLVEVSAIPPKVKNMYYTFVTCTSLVTAPSIPASVEKMNGTFSGCTSLVSVPDIPNSVISMNYAFSGCSNLIHNRGILTATKVTDLVYTFQNCTSLKEAYLPPNLMGGYDVFYQCTALETIPDMSYLKELINLGSFFDSCTSLTTVEKLPPNVKNMQYTFIRCSSLEIPPELPYGVRFLSGTFQQSGIKVFPTLPSTVTSIYSLCSDGKVTEIPSSFPSGITSMSYFVNNCPIKEVNGLVIPGKVTSVASLFSGCAELEKVSGLTLHSGITSLSSMFSGCTNLRELPDFRIPSKTVNMNATFVNCSSLEGIEGLTIPSGVTDLRSAFKGCTNFTGTIQVNVDVDNILYNSSDQSKNSCYQCFMDTTKSITIKGNGKNTTVLNLLKGTATNGNVTIS